MKIADQLTLNADDFALYLTDVTDEIFAVDEHGKVRIVDLESVLVVDKLAVKAGKTYCSHVIWKKKNQMKFVTAIFGSYVTGSPTKEYYI